MESVPMVYITMKDLTISRDLTTLLVCLSLEVFHYEGIHLPRWHATQDPVGPCMVCCGDHTLYLLGILLDLPHSEYPHGHDPHGDPHHAGT